MAFPYLSDLIRELIGVDLPLPIPMFGLMVAVALIASVRVAGTEVRRLHEGGKIGMARISGRQADGGASLLPPHEMVGDLAVFALIFGFVGARIFHFLEYPREFLANPWAMIFSRSGFTFYGGLIAGAVAGGVYVRKRGLAMPAFCDALAPAMMLGYAIGRIGCQLSGDGDWGTAADVAVKPDWLPLWLWAQTYENNIVGVAIQAPGVYPTPIYETLMGLAAFLVLWRWRKHPFRSGWLFSLYLLLAGIERFAIEQIRVDAVMSIYGLAVTQAEIISGISILAGTAGLILLSCRKEIPHAVARST